MDLRSKDDTKRTQLGNEDGTINEKEGPDNEERMPMAESTDKTNNSLTNEEEDIDFIFDNIVGGGDGGDLGQWVILAALIPIGLCAGFPLFMHLFADLSSSS